MLELEWLQGGLLVDQWPISATLRCKPDRPGVRRASHPM
jgi:hypothetical protein